MKEKKKLIIALILVILLVILVVVIVKNNQTVGLEVTFDCHGGTKIESQKLKKGELLEKPEDPTKEGYEFIGWYYDGEKFDFDQEIDKNIKLEAKWLKVESIKYTVTFDTNGGSSISEQKIEKGKTVKRPNDPTKSGYTFVEWTLNGESYDFSDKVEKNMTLSAVWKQNSTSINVNKPSSSHTSSSNNKIPSKPTVIKPQPEKPAKKVYKVTFYDHDVVIGTQEVTEGNFVAVPKNPTKEHYTFLNWSYNGKPFNFSQPVTSDMKIYAEWTALLELKSAQTIDFDSVNLDPTEDPSGHIVYNQKSIDIVQKGGVITVTKKQPLHSYLNASGMTKQWYAMLLDFGVNPANLKADGYTINPEDITEAKRFGATNDTTFIVWLDASNRTLSFKNKDDENIVGTVSIEVKADYPVLTMNPVLKLNTVDASEAELKYNNDSITVTTKEYVVSVKEDMFLHSYTKGTAGNWYGLVFDLGVDPTKITADGYVIDTNVASYGVTSSTAFIMWFTGTKVDDTKTINFKSTIDTNDTLTITVNFDAKTGIQYKSSGTITGLPAEVVYHADREAFELTASDIDMFTFEDDGQKKQAKMDQNGAWSIDDIV